MVKKMIQITAMIKIKLNEALNLLKKFYFSHEVSHYYNARDNNEARGAKKFIIFSDTTF